MWFYIFALIFIFLETSFFNHLAIFSIRPNLILFLVTLFSFYFNFDILKVLLFCLFCGLLKDMFSIVPLGTNMFIFICLGIGLSYLSRKFLRYNWVFIMPLYILASIGEVIIYVLMEDIFFDRSLSLLFIFWRILILEMAYTFLIFFIFLKPIKKCVIDKLS
jgi:rod shape-determining protein MreD